jgi:hypothetical protein
MEQGMMKKKLEKGVIVLGWSTLLGVFISFHYIGWLAFFSEGKTVTLYINRFNEAIPEAILLIISLPCILYVIIRWFQDGSCTRKMSKL